MAAKSCVWALLVMSILANMTACLKPEHFILATTQFPEDDRFRPAIGNGHVATNVLSDTVYMNGVHNGNGSDSHRARIPATSSIDVVDGNVDSNRGYSLNMLTGVFTLAIEREDAKVSLQYFAHRKMSRLLVTILTVTRRQQGEITINLNVNSGEKSVDLNDFVNITERADDNTMARKTTIKVTETAEMQPTSIIQFFTRVPESVTLATNKDTLKQVFITSTSINEQDAWNAYQDAVKMSADDLLQGHVKAWGDLWNEGSLELSGNDDLAKNINAGLYYILSSTPLQPDPVNPFRGLSPGGLSRGGRPFPNKTSPYNDYLGHVFWDMDTWILPPIMTLHPQLAKIFIGSRTRALPTVRKHATDTGYKGARFPWEQGITGSEVCPWDPATIFQIHVTADVSLSLRQYLDATNDASIVGNDGKGMELAMDIARFWKSRVVKNEENKYEIWRVMGPDEYHFNINNSVFTNYNAKLSLQLPARIQNIYKPSVTDAEAKEIKEFQDIGENMVILFDEKKQYHPQFEGFYLNESIKQSDVVLLGFPLMMEMSPTVRRNDLLLYENLTDRFGPDTGTWSMHTLTRLELGDEAEAAEDFRMTFRNINGPFKVFSEKPPNNPQGVRCVNFITGAGGLLQAVIFGYGGIRIRDSHLEIRPHLLPNTTDWAIRGFHYRGFVFDLAVKGNTFEVTVTQEKKDMVFYLSKENGEREALKPGVKVQRPLAKFKVTTAPKKTSPTSSSPSNHMSSVLACIGVVIYLFTVFFQ